ncbi:hypothetical protein K1X76_05830 [bacterium]|nr:hypothetical protein [bacterium]
MQIPKVVMMKQIVLFGLVFLQATVAIAGDYPSLRNRSRQDKKQEEAPSVTQSESSVVTNPPVEIIPAQNPNDTAPYYEKQYDSRTDTFKPLSTGIGWGLALSPIGGDGLIYTGHPVWGGLLIFQQAVGVPLLIAGLKIDGDDDFGFKGIALGFGVTFVASAFLVDAVMTPLLVHKHNKNLKSPAKRIEPTVSYDGKTIQGGVQMRF